MKIQCIFIVSLFLFLSWQTNAQFLGGNGDGFALEESHKNILTGEMITFMFIGGNGDGFALEESHKNILTGEMITFMFAGGNGDGFALEESDKNILTGEMITFMFAGGNGDGFALEESHKNILTGEMITFMFAGGNGDGYSAVQESVFLDPNQVVDLRMNIKVFLQGPLLNPVNTGLMNDILRSDGKLPTSSPYQDLLTINPSILNDGGTTGTGLSSDDIVDWIWVELRSNTDNTNVVNSKSALVQRDGDIVDLDGISELFIPAITDSYFIVVKHRNHLGVMTLNPLALSVTPININFTSNATSTFGSHAQVQLLSGDMALWAGDSNGLGEVRYSGTNNDSNLIKDYVLGDPDNAFNSVTFSSSGYLFEDIDLNGFAKFSGSGNDSNFIKDNVLNHPSNGFNSLTFTIFSTVPPEN